MIVDPAELSHAERYHWMIASIVPRPIALTSTISPEGVTNVAPFRFLNGVCADPPILSLSIGNRREGGPKDTLRNARDTGELVVNLAPATLARKVVDASAAIPAGESEFDFADLTPVASERVKPPRVAESPLSMECVTHRIVEVGNGPQHLLLAEIVLVHVDDAILTDGYPDPAKLDPLGRLGGKSYATLGKIFQEEFRRG